MLTSNLFHRRKPQWVRITRDTRIRNTPVSAGEVVEVAPEDADALLASGRAVPGEAPAPEPAPEPKPKGKAK